MDADVIVVGAGLAGLVAAAELADAGRTRAACVDQESPSRPRRAGVLVVRRAVPRRQPRAAPDGHQGLASTWPGRTGRARPGSTGSTTRTSGRAQWAEAYVDFAAGEKRAWLHEQGMRFFPVVGWAERGDGTRGGPRQLGPALPHHVGHRPGRGGAVRAPGAASTSRRAGWSSGSGTGSTSWSPTDGAVTGVARHGARARRRRARGGPLTATRSATSS